MEEREREEEEEEEKDESPPTEETKGSTRVTRQSSDDDHEEREREEEERAQKLKEAKEIKNAQKKEQKEALAKTAEGRLRELHKMKGKPTDQQLREIVILEKLVADNILKELTLEQTEDLYQDIEIINGFMYKDREDDLSRGEKQALNNIYKKFGLGDYYKAPPRAHYQTYYNLWSKFIIGVGRRVTNKYSKAVEIGKKQSKAPTFTGQVQTLQSSGGGGARRPFALDTSQEPSRQELKSPGAKRAQQDLDDLGIEVERAIGGK
jgi:hypothetical protein